MVKFHGLVCACNAIADEIERQYKGEDKAICFECWNAHKVLANSILRNPKEYYYDYRMKLKRDLKKFKKWTFPTSPAKPSGSKATGGDTKPTTQSQKLTSYEAGKVGARREANNCAHQTHPASVCEILMEIGSPDICPFLHDKDEAMRNCGDYKPRAERGLTLEGRRVR